MYKINSIEPDSQYPKIKVFLIHCDTGEMILRELTPEHATAENIRELVAELNAKENEMWPVRELCKRLAAELIPAPGEPQ